MSFYFRFVNVCWMIHVLNFIQRVTIKLILFPSFHESQKISSEPVYNFVCPAEVEHILRHISLNLYHAKRAVQNYIPPTESSRTLHFTQRNNNIATMSPSKSQHNPKSSKFSAVKRLFTLPNVRIWIESQPHANILILAAKFNWPWSPYSTSTTYSILRL